MINFYFNNKLINANVDILDVKNEVDTVLLDIVANKGNILMSMGGSSIRFMIQVE
jgi:hypothetical protein